MSGSSNEETCKITGPPQVQDPAILNVGQGHILSSVGANPVQQASINQSAPLVQSAGVCPQHPHHHHHHGPQQHQDLPHIQMAMPVNPMATQCNSAHTQQPTIIFASAPPGHPMSMPVMAGFPPAPNMQVHSAVNPSMLGVHHGHQTHPPPLGHTQAIHIHHHPGQSLPPHLQRPNIHGFPPIPYSQTQPISSDNTHIRGPINQQQEFNDPAIMSVSKLPPPRSNVHQQGAHTNSLTTNMMQMNPKRTDISHQHESKPCIPANSNVKSVQDLERELMGGPVVNHSFNNSIRQANKTSQQNKPQGQMVHRGGYNSAPRYSQSGFRNNHPNQVRAKKLGDILVYNYLT